MPSEDVIQEALSVLHGNKDRFREQLLDTETLLRHVCDYVESMANKKRTEPWVIMRKLMPHGSGMCHAIYEMYRKREQPEVPRD